MLKSELLVALAVGAVMSSLADTVKIRALVLDDSTQQPMPNVDVCFSFKEDIGWEVWTRGTPYHKQHLQTDMSGSCLCKGESNCGTGGCYVENPPQGYYVPNLGWGNKYKHKNLFGVWQPDNLVATIRLQRVEHPIPLTYKEVKLKDREKGLGRIDDRHWRLEYDLMEGDWLPPYGVGKIADLRFESELTLTGSETKRYGSNGDFTTQFYDIQTVIGVVGEHDGIREVIPPKSAGIRIRVADDEGLVRSVVRATGCRKIMNRDGRDWHCEKYEDYDESRCYVFRIRSRYDEDGKLVEAYYGKIYGDFAFEPSYKVGCREFNFSYYLNPTSMDRNLEWDMKTNLCPHPCECRDHQP